MSRLLCGCRHCARRGAQRIGRAAVGCGWRIAVRQARRRRRPCTSSHRASDSSAIAAGISRTMFARRRCQQQREAVRQIGHARPPASGHAERAGQEARPEDEIADHQALAAEEDQADVEAVRCATGSRDRRARAAAPARRPADRLALPSTNSEGSEEQLADGLDRDGDDVEQHREQGQVARGPAEQDVEDDRQRDRAGQMEQVGRDAEAPERTRRPGCWRWWPSRRRARRACPGSAARPPMPAAMTTR